VFPLAFVGILSWLAFRLVNLPKFAEFLISVEAEMAKVSWPSKQELFRATSVVIGSMAFLTLVLFLFDAFWAWLLTTLGVVVT
jgi:preprotein translocase subunit SecE